MNLTIDITSKEPIGVSFRIRKQPMGATHWELGIVMDYEETLTIKGSKRSFKRLQEVIFNTLLRKSNYDSR